MTIVFRRWLMMGMLVFVAEVVVADDVGKNDANLVPLTAATKAGQEWDGNDVKMKFCWCPDGTFLMGSPPDEAERWSDEDQVSVTLSGYWLGKYEVTQGEWKALMGTTQAELANKGNVSKKLVGTGPKYPIYFVNHIEATAFAKKLTEQERASGRLPADWEYRLPTEAQWEYACRAGTTTATAFGTNLESRAANFDGTIPYNKAKKGPNLNRTCEVGKYMANAWGLHDMHGNVWELCRDWYEVKLPGGSNPEVSTKTEHCVSRGGCWSGGGKLCRSACRSQINPNTRFNLHGFRLAVVRVSP